MKQVYSFHASIFHKLFPSCLSSDLPLAVGGLPLAVGRWRSAAGGQFWNLESFGLRPQDRPWNTKQSI